MSEELPEPLTGSHDEIENYDSFMLNVDRLMASELMAIATGDEFKAAVALWCRAWKQVPAGSLPDDDKVLAAFSGSGRNWKRVKAMALRGFIKCSDGRLYHKVLCADVKRAAKQRADYAAERQSDRERLKKWRELKRDKKQRGNGNETPSETHDETVSHPFQNDDETRTKRLRQGRAGHRIEERKNSDPNGSGAASAPPPISDQDRLWRDGVPYLRDRGGKPEPQARSILGKWAKVHGARRVIEAIALAQAKETIDPVAFIVAALGDKSKSDETFVLQPLGAGG